jgi:hypothetical protein
MGEVMRACLNSEVGTEPAKAASSATSDVQCTRYTGAPAWRASVAGDGPPRPRQRAAWNCSTRLSLRNPRGRLP